MFMTLICEPGVQNSCQKRAQSLSRTRVKSVPLGEVVGPNMGVPGVELVGDVGQEEERLGRASREALGNRLNRVRSSRFCIPRLRPHS